MSEEITEYATGWVNDPEAVAEFVAELPWKNFATTEAAGLTFGELPEVFLGFKHYEEVTGQPWPVWNQGSYGTCVAHGEGKKIVYTAACEIKRGDKEQIKMPSRDVIYAGSRVEVGGGRYRSDGSNGAWAAKWINKWGVVPAEKFGEHDLTEYSGARSRKWGAPGAGVPSELEAEAKKHPMGACTLVTNFEDACVALFQGYGINVCSDRGFRMTRDSEGFCSPSGTWNHSMSFIGFRKGKRPGLLLDNSWGATSTGGPRPDGIPPSSWWVDASVCNYMLGQKDSFTGSNFDGFPLNLIDWLI